MKKKTIKSVKTIGKLDWHDTYVHFTHTHIYIPILLLLLCGIDKPQNIQLVLWFHQRAGLM